MSFNAITVLKVFGGLVIFRAIAGNITSYSRDSLLLHGLFTAKAGNCPSFAFPAIDGIFLTFNLGIVQAFYCEEEKPACQKRHLCQCIVQCSDKTWEYSQLQMVIARGSVLYNQLQHGFLTQANSMLQDLFPAALCAIARKTPRLCHNVLGTGLGQL